MLFIQTLCLFFGLIILIKAASYNKLCSYGKCKFVPISSFEEAEYHDLVYKHSNNSYSAWVPINTTKSQKCVFALFCLRLKNKIGISRPIRTVGTLETCLHSFFGKFSAISKYARQRSVEQRVQKLLLMLSNFQKSYLFCIDNIL